MEPFGSSPHTPFSSEKILLTKAEVAWCLVTAAVTFFLSFTCNWAKEIYSKNWTDFKNGYRFTTMPPDSKQSEAISDVSSKAGIGTKSEVTSFSLGSVPPLVSFNTNTYNDFINKEYLKRVDLFSPQLNFDKSQSANTRKFNVQWGCAEQGEYSDHAENEKEEFVEFRVKTPIIDTENHWKIHISVNKDDLPRAWDLIFPMLCQHAYAFKVIKLNILKQKINAIDFALNQSDEEQLKDMILKIQSINSNNIQKLKDELEKLEPFHKSLSFKERGRKAALPELIRQMQNMDYRKLAEESISSKKDLERSKESILRLLNGLQVTIYIPKGRENEHYELIKKIEKQLLSHNIRPGQVYQTDKPIDQFSSIRHPGKSKYVAGVDAQSYNPDNLPDPF